MSSRTSRLLPTKVAKRKWHLSLIKNPMHARDKMISRMCKHMNLLKVNTFISMRICAGWSMHLLSSKLNCFSSSGWMFLFMCRYSLCSVVYRFLWNNKRKKKFVSYYLFTMCKFQWITTNKTWKKWQTPRVFTEKMRIRLYRRTIRCLSLSSQACFTHFDTRILDYKTSH